MKVHNVREATSWFQVFHTERHSQTAVMTLAPGHRSGGQPEAHEKSEQTLFLVDGELFATVASKSWTLKKGDFLVIPAGVTHQFENRGKIQAITFNVYAPPEYPPGEKG
jgi:mannose-6-phosphate isomerase-like protein (cupin superfamily)